MDTKQTNQPDARLSRLLEIQAELDARKALYTEFDALVMSLAADGFDSAIVNDLTLELVDNFSAGNTAFTAAAIKRYDLKVLTPEQVARREKKRAKENQTA